MFVTATCLKDSLKHPIATIRRMFEEKKDALDGVVTDAKLEKRLKSVSCFYAAESLHRSGI